MTNRTTAIIGAVGVVLAVALGAVTVKLANDYLAPTDAYVAGAATPACRTFKVVIEDDVVTPEHVSAHLCDQLTILNRDPQERVVAFGQHENHVAYDGIAEKFLEHGQMFTVTLNQAGEFLFHDHEHEEVRGTFSVAP